MNRGCGDVSTFVRHAHEQITSDDIFIRLEWEEDFLDKACLEVRRQAGKVQALIAHVPVKVTRSNDEDCAPGEKGELVLRAGEPFPYVIFDVCNHHHVFTPPRSQTNKAISVKVAIVVRPA
jgi:hypothetical protein